ncbi:MAG: glycosyltransferase [Candidatus Methanoperedenaceae archaeon]|nr:glycosyltransferase [Candidatus Methanoperedenaceae archaeon]
MTILLSIVIPTYNRALYLKRCLNSLIAYNGDDIEIIVQDNCSPDNTNEIVKSIKDSRIKYYRNNVNLGLAPNIINILNRVTGKYVFYITDDDFLFPDAIEKIKTFIIDYDPIAFTSDIITYFEKTHVATNFSCSKNNLIVDSDDFDNNAKIILSAGVITRVCFDVSQLDINYLQKYGGDWFPQILMVGYLSSKGRLGYKAEPLGIHTWENEVYWNIKDKDVNEKFNNSMVDVIIALTNVLNEKQIKAIIKLYILQNYGAYSYGIHPKLKQYLNTKEIISLNCLGIMRHLLIVLKNKILFNFYNILNLKNVRKD